ncbi:LysR family transcriptional regulator [Sphingobium sp. TomTYG45]
MKQLRYFVAIADAGSLVRASERIGIAQPALSVQLANLEAELGTQLLIRSNRGIELTEDGVVLLQRARDLIEQHSSIVAEMKSLRTPTGSLIVGLPSNAIRLFAPAIYQAVATSLPKVRLHIAEMSSAFLYESLLERRIDFAVLVNVAPLEGMEITPIFSEAFCYISREPSTSDMIPFDDLAQRRLILSGQSTSWRKILDAISTDRDLSLDILLETDSVFVMEAMLQDRGCGAIAPASAFWIGDNPPSFSIRRIVEPEICSELSLVHNRVHKLSRIEAVAAPLIIEACREASRRWSRAAGVSDKSYPPAQPVRPVTPEFPTHKQGAQQRSR